MKERRGYNAPVGGGGANWDVESEHAGDNADCAAGRAVGLI